MRATVGGVDLAEPTQPVRSRAREAEQLEPTPCPTHVPHAELWAGGCWCWGLAHDDDREAIHGGL